MQLRREKIAERMKSLQELIPNSNKVLLLLVAPIIVEQSCLCLLWSPNKNTETLPWLSRTFTFKYVD